MVPLEQVDQAREVVLIFEDSDLCRPIIIGLRHAGASELRRKSLEPAPQLLSFTGAAIGTLIDAQRAESPLVDFPGNPNTRPVAASACVELGAKSVGAKVVLMFENSDPAKPIVLGVLREKQPPQPTEPALHPCVVELDGEPTIFTAQSEMVLRCGEASITLTRAGKVLIRGEYISSRSSGVNSIKGGAVRIN
jgi:hypothetical protein